MTGISRTLVGAVAVVALAVTACQSGGGDPTRSPSPAGGVPYRPGGPVLAVKIDNVTAARPPTGLGAADIVYVEPVEAGLSRLLAVYSSELPRRVGPVRSARASDLELLRQFGRPVFAYSGARSSLLPDIRRARLYDVSPAHAADAYQRRGPHSAPHDLYARPADLLDHAEGAKRPTDIGFRYGEAPPGGSSATGRSVAYEAFDIRFGWSAQRRRWLVSMDGEPHRTAGGTRSAASTVVVQYVDVEPRGKKDAHGDISPYVTTTGSGKAVVLRNGRAYEGRWRRPRPDEGTTYTTAAGEPMRFAEGQVWVVLAER